MKAARRKKPKKRLSIRSTLLDPLPVRFLKSEISDIDSWVRRTRTSRSHMIRSAVCLVRRGLRTGAITMEQLLVA